MRKNNQLTTTIAQPVRDAALNSFTDAERVLYQRIRRMYESKVEKDIWWHWELGEVLCRAFRDNARRQVRRDVVRRIAIAMGWPEKEGANLLLTDRRLVDAFRNRSHLQRYLKLRGPNGHRLTWSHLNLLALLTDEQARWQMANTVIGSELSVEQLRARLTEQRKALQVFHSKTGRPFRIPSDVETALWQLREHSERFSRMCSEIFMGERFDICAQLDQLDPKQLTSDLHTRLGETVESLQQLCQQLQTLQTRLRQLRQTLFKEIPHAVCK